MKATKWMIEQEFSRRLNFLIVDVQRLSTVSLEKGAAHLVERMSKQVRIIEGLLALVEEHKKAKEEQ